MSVSKKAKLVWVPAEAGGRKTPFSGLSYSTVARFEEDAVNWPKSAWSIVAEFEEPPGNSSQSIAMVHFLSPDAPVHLLHRGSQFELYEGRRAVARGEIIE